jgi:ribosome-associated heat shock protein Hsp15
MQDTRLDKWLWAARFYKTRSLAQQAIERGHVRVGGETVKTARAVRIGDELQVRTGETTRTVRVRAVSEFRGPASQAQLLYEETEASIRLRVQAMAQRTLQMDPARAIEGGRPTKRDRRALQRWRGQR